MKNIFLILIVSILITSCDAILPVPLKEDEVLDGHIEGLSSEELIHFLNGDAAFNKQVFTQETGLGPIFVASSCGTCHAGDGKGHPSTTLIRFGQSDTSGNKFLQLGGPQIQNFALAGYSPETIPIGASYSKFTPPANTGLGYLDLVSDEDIIALSDPDDKDNDGISGVPNWKSLSPYLSPRENSITKNGKYIHRFGKKASAYDLLHQTVNAYNQDMGITSSFEPKDVYSHQNIDPEISNKTISDVVFYLKALKAPIQRNASNSDVLAGKLIFKQINCESCHKETLKTSFSNITALSNKEFHPYTDLLLHDMGSELDDNYTEGSALTSEWRTPPLWGLGLSPMSQGGKFYLMHDGRAKSIEEAILLHGGEASKSRQNYINLNSIEKNKLIEFLKSL